MECGTVNVYCKIVGGVVNGAFVCVCVWGGGGGWVSVRVCEVHVQHV